MQVKRRRTRKGEAKRKGKGKGKGEGKGKGKGKITKGEGTVEGEDPLSGYIKYTKKKVLFILVCLGLLVIMAIVSVSIGSVDLSLQEVWSSLFGGGEKMSRTIIWNIRLPRVLTAIVAGVGLSVSGAAMQTILRNPLGSPFTLGISHTAAFGAAFAIVVLEAGTLQSDMSDAVLINNPYIVTISAFLWSLVSTAVILLLAKYKGASPETMILTGVALGSLFIAGTTAIQYFATDVQLSSIIFWTFGDIGRTSWRDLYIMTAIIVPSSIYFIYKSWSYNALDSGEETAKSLGIDVERIRLHGMLLAALVTALVISFVGIIGFLGLVVPHIVRKITGGDERFLMPATCVFGGLLLLASDTVARTVISPIVLPVGVLTSFMGAPMFIYLVIKGREYW